MHDASTVLSPASEEREPEELDAGSTRTSAMDLGDVTVHRLPEGLQRLVQTVGFEGDAVDYYRFELTESREVRMALQARSGEVELYLEDSVGEVLSRSMAFASYELVVRTLPAGTYYLRVLPAGTGGSEYEFKYGVFPADDAWRPWDPEPSLAERLGMPSFEESEYGFALAEHADGSLERVSLGVVTATDTNGDALHYALVGGNESGRFAIDAETGELFYTGPGEDYEGGAGPHELTVRAGDGTHTVDATVTVTVTDVPEAPAFTQASYAFALAEHADGSETRVALGTVSATDPDGDALRYALVGGNESGRFAIDAESGELFYAGPGEDHEGGAGPHELTVRVSDGTHTDEATQTVDATVTVTVTDVPEAPAFTQASYAFALAEHTDGSEARVALGTVSATDPDGDALRYALVGGNESGRFAIDAETGELFYAGPGEDYETGAGPHELTVRASDGELAAETAVTVTVTDVGNDSEPADGDLPADRTTGAVVRVDEGPVRGRIESTRDVDWFAVDLVGGRTYQFDQRGHSSGDGTLIDPFLLGLFDSVGAYIEGTTAPDGGIRYDSRLEFTAARDGRHYIAAAGNGYEESGTGTYELEARTVPTPVFGASSYAFALAENVDGSETRVALGAVSATDPDGDALRYRLVGGNESGLFAIDAASGELSYVGAGEDYESGAGPYELTVRASEGTHTVDATVTVTVTDVPEAPAFTQASYAFALAEHTDGSEARVSLGVVSATDPDGEALHYALVGGNESGRFAIDAETGELFYAGPGEDHESGAGSHELTVRGSDGAHTVDATVTVTVTDVPEAPAFTQARYGFTLAEHTDGSEARVALGTVTATDPDGDALRYTLVGGNESGRFAIDAETGELFYAGPGEDHESGAGPHELTVRAGDGTHTVDATVTVTVTDVPEAPAFTQASYAFALAEHTDGSGSRVSLGTVQATDPDGGTVRYSLVGGNESGLFAIDEASGELSYAGPGEDYEGGAGPFELTVRASDGASSTDAPVTVTVTDEAETPAFEETSYAFNLAESVGGNVEPVSLGTVQAADPDGGDTLRYTLVGGNEAGLFAIGETSGEVFYVGTGEDFEDGAGPFDLTVQASDGTHKVDATVTVTVVEFDPASGKAADPRGSSEPEGEDLPAEQSTSGEVLVDSEEVEGTLRSQSDRDWFAVTLAPGRTYEFYLERDVPTGGTAPVIRGLRDANGNPVPGVVGGTEVRYTTDASAPESVYYVEIGGAGTPGQEASASRGLGTRSISIVPRSNSDGGIDYRLRVNDVTTRSDTSDDYASDTSTTGMVSVDGSVPGNIESPGDRDWFAVTLKAGSFYRFDLTGSGSGDGTLRDPFLRGIHDNKGRLLPGTTNDDGLRWKQDSRVRFSPAEDGTYYVAAGAFGADLGTYRLSVSQYEDDYLASIHTTGRVAVGGSTNGRYNFQYDFQSDRDWFQVTLVAGKAYQIDVKGADTGDGSLRDPYLTAVLDAKGKALRGTANFDGGVGSNSRISIIAPADGPYYVSVGAQLVLESGHLRNPGSTYTVSVKEIPNPPDDYPAGTDTTGRVLVGDSTTGNIEHGGDRDWIAVELEAGTTYWIDLKGLWSRDGTLRDPVIHGVYDSQGRLIPSTYDANSGTVYNARLLFTAGTDDTYYVSAGTRSSYPWIPGGTYTLSVRSAEYVDDYPSHSSTNGRVVVGGSTTGSIDFPGDRDWIGVELEPGWRYRFDLKGADTGDGTLLDPVIERIFGANGHRFPNTYDDDGGTGHNSRSAFTPASAGTYYVSVRSDTYRGEVSERALLGTYRLSVTRFADDHPSSVHTTGGLEVGGSTTGSIDFGFDRHWSRVYIESTTTNDYRYDRDWFRVTLEAGKSYQIDIRTQQDGYHRTFTRPEISGIHDASGRQLPHLGDLIGRYWFSHRAYFDAPADGVYYVSAGSWFGSRPATYTLSIAESGDAHTTNSATAGRVEIGGGPTAGRIDYFGDSDWFAVTMQLGKSYWFVVDGNRAWGMSDPGGDPISLRVRVDNRSQFEFDPAVSGTYFLEIGTPSPPHPRLPGEGPYTLSVMETEPSSGDYAASTATTGTVAVDRSVRGVIGVDGDGDWFAVPLVANRIYRFDLKGEPTGDGTLANPYLRGIHDSQGNLIDGTTNDDGGDGSNSRVVFTPNETGTYFVAAEASSGQTGSYTLSVTGDDYASATGTTGRLAVGGSTSGEIDYRGDVDWFAVTLEAGKVYRFDLKGGPTGDGTLRNPHLRGIYDSESNLVDGTTDNDGGSSYNSQVEFVAKTGGTYYVAAGGAGNHQGTYRLSATEIMDDYASKTGTTGRLAVGGSTPGAIDYRGDLDWFAVTLEAGKVYRFDLKGGPTGDGTLRNPYLRGIYDSESNLVDGTTDNDGGSSYNSQVEFVAKTGGTYYVAAGGAGNHQGTYRLSATEIMDDYPSTTGTTGRLTVGGSTPGAIDYRGDVDWFAVTLEAGKGYRFDLKGGPTGDGTLRNPYLRGIYDSESNLVDGTTDNDGGSSYNSRVEFVAETGGTYFVAARGSGNHQGTYRLSVTEIADDYASATGTTGRLAVGGSTPGAIDFRGDLDWFAVTLEAGNVYRFDLKGGPTGDGTLRNPYLRGIYDSESNLVDGTSDDDGGSSYNSQVDFVVETGGTYYVAAGGSGDHQGTYRLSVTEIADDYPSGTGTTGMLAVGGSDSPSGAVDYRGDRDWFAVTLEAGKSYRFDLEGSASEAGTVDGPRLYGIYDSDGNEVEGATIAHAFFDLYSQAVFAPDTNATYYVSVGATGTSRGTYTLSVSEIADDYASDTSTTGMVEVGGSTPGFIDYAEDRDWFAVSLSADTEYRFRAIGAWDEDAETESVWLPVVSGLYDAAGESVDGLSRNSVNNLGFFTPEEAGTYYVSVGLGISRAHYGTYTVSVEEVTEGM